MKTKIYLFAVIFITSIMSSLGLYATQTHIPGDQLTPDSWHVFCGDENDSIIVHKPVTGMTTVYFKYEVTLEIFWDVDSIIITMETMGLWRFYSEETGAFFFSVYIVSESPTQPTCMAEPITTCALNFSEVLDAENEGPGTTYLWSTGANTRTITVQTPGTYAVTVTNACGEGVYSVDISYTNSNAPDLGPDQTVCVGEQVLLTTSVINPVSVIWQPGNITTPDLEPTTSGTYSCYVVDDNGCSGRDTVVITFNSTPAQPILLATINTDPLDPKYGNNKVVWEVDPMQEGNYSVNIHRETETEVYPLLTTVDYTVGEWTDDVSSVNQAWRYKISINGECGTSELSPFVQTIKTIVFQDVNDDYVIQWTEYIVESKGVVTYKIYSGNQLDNLTEQMSVSGSVTLVSVPTTTDSLFIVGAELSVGGTKTTIMAFSNKASNPLWNTVPLEQSPVIGLYPNPTTTQLTLSITADQASIYTLLGQELLTETNTSVLDVNTLPTGLYVLQITIGDKIYKKQFAKQ